MYRHADAAPEEEEEAGEEEEEEAWACEWCKRSDDDFEGTNFKARGPNGVATLCKACSTHFDQGATKPPFKQNADGAWECECGREFETLIGLSRHKNACKGKAASGSKREREQPSSTVQRKRRKEESQSESDSGSESGSSEDEEPEPAGGSRAWTAKELQRLRSLVRRDGAGDWEAKAEELGTGRTGGSLSNKYYQVKREWDEGGAAAGEPAGDDEQTQRKKPRVAAAPECLLLSDISKGQEVHKIPVYGPTGQPTPFDAPRSFRYTKSVEWRVAQPKDWAKAAPSPRRGACPCTRWAPSTFMTLDLSFETDPPTVEQLKERIIEALRAPGDESEISVQIETHTDNDADEEATEAKPDAQGTALVGCTFHQEFQIDDRTPPTMRWYRGTIKEWDAAAESYLVKYDDGEQKSIKSDEIRTLLEDEAVAAESQWFRVPDGAAAMGFHSLAKIAARVKCDVGALLELNRRHFDDLTMSTKFKAATMLQLPRNSAAPTGCVYLRSVHLECGLPFAKAKRALCEMRGLGIMSSCEDKSEESALVGDAPSTAAARASGGEGGGEASEDEGTDEAGFEVDKIVKKGVVHNADTQEDEVMYLVRWLGYGPAQDTWQSLDDLAHAQEKVAEFENRGRGMRFEELPPDAVGRELVERGPLVTSEEMSLFDRGTHLWVKWHKADIDEWHKGEITRISATIGWFDMKFEGIVLKEKCFHLSRYISDKSLCWTADGPPSSPERQAREAGAAAAASPQGASSSSPAAAARKPGRGYYDAEGRLRASFALPVRECSALCGCNRNCANRVVQKGIQQPGLQIHWMGKKGWGITCSQPLAAGTFIAECELLSRVPEQTCGCFGVLC